MKDGDDTSVCRDVSERRGGWGGGLLSDAAGAERWDVRDVWLRASERKLQSAQQNTEKSPGLVTVQALKREREVSDGGRASARGEGGAANVPVLILSANRSFGFPASKAGLCLLIRDLSGF